MTTINITPIPFTRRYTRSLTNDLRIENPSVIRVAVLGRSDEVVIVTTGTLSAPEQTALEDIINAHDSLVVSVDLATINTVAPDDEATITCSDAVITSDANLDYVVWDGDNQIASGSQAVVAGTMTLTFSSGAAGTFVIEIRRQGATDYETGYITIEVVE